jgi:hypothetical protein
MKNAYLDYNIVGYVISGIVGVITWGGDNQISS